MDAVALGYRGVEADVFLIDGVLRVGHSKSEARERGTFEALYVRPLERMNEWCVPPRSRTPFLFFVELKQSSRDAYDSLVNVLARHDLPGKEMRVILVGSHPDNTDLAIQYRLDEPEVPGSLPKNVELITLDYDKTVGRFWNSESRRLKWLKAISETKSRFPRVMLRVHNVSPDDATYATLLKSGVDLIGTKDLLRTYRILANRR